MNLHTEMTVVLGGLLPFFCLGGTWTGTSVNTPATAYEWTNEVNWTSGVVPQGEGIAGIMSADFPSSGSTWVHIPETGLTLGYYRYVPDKSNSHNLYLLGGPLRLTDASTWLRGNLNYLNVCTPVTVGEGKTLNLYGNPTVTVMAPVTAEIVCPYYGTVRFFADTYATSGGDVETNPFPTGTYRFDGAGSVHFIPRQKAVAVTATLNATKGSNFVTADASSTLIAGQVLTTETSLFPAGTYVAQRYADKAYRMSAPALETGAAALSFSAVSPQTTQRVKEFNVAKNVSLSFGRRDDSPYSFAAGTMRGPGNVTLAVGSGFSDVGVFSVSNAASYTGSVSVKQGRLELCGAEGAPTVLQGLTVLADATVSTVSVPAGATGEVASVVVKNALTKLGAGTLRARSFDFSLATKVDLQAGRLELAGEGDFTLAKLTVAAGAILYLGEGVTLTVADATFAGPVRTEGPGCLVVTKLAEDPERIELADGGTLRLTEDRTRRPTGSTSPSVCGDPAFWLDAGDLTAGGAGVASNGDITRWTDTRGTAGCHFATNFGVKCPTLLVGLAPGGRNLVNIERVDGVYTQSQGLCWDEPVTGIKSAFMVLDAASGAGIFLAQTPRVKSTRPDFFRNSWQNYNEGILYNDAATSTMRGAEWRVNGKTVSATATGGYEPGFQLVEFHLPSTKSVSVDGFGFDANAGNRANGANRICEFLCYTNELSDLERKEIAGYLTKKWLAHDYVRADENELCVGEVSVMGNGAIDVAEGDRLKVTRLSSDASTVVKTGAGEAEIDETLATGATVHVAEGVLTLHGAITSAGSLPRGTALRLDASDGTTLETWDDGATVHCWHDAGGSPYVARMRQGNATRPSVLPEALNGLSVLDFGSFGSTKRFMQIMYAPTGKSTSGVYPDNNGLQPVPAPTDVFAVIGSQGGGNALFRSPTVSSTAGNFAIRSKYRYLSGTTTLGTSLGETYLNGNRVKDPCSTAYSETDYDLVSWHAYGADERLGFAGIGINLLSDGDYFGGQRIAEFVVCTNKLTRREQGAVRAWLSKKWFDRTVSGYAGAALSGLSVDAGASFATDGDVLTLDSLAGAGTLSAGSYALMAGGSILPAADDQGRIIPLSLADGVSLTPGASATVVLPAEVKLVADEYPLFSGGTVEADGTVWTVTGRRSDRCQVVLREGRPYLSVRSPGMIIMVR